MRVNEGDCGLDDVDNDGVANVDYVNDIDSGAKIDVGGNGDGCCNDYYDDDDNDVVNVDHIDDVGDGDGGRDDVYDGCDNNVYAEDCYTMMLM